jgi:hypothetical protein
MRTLRRRRDPQDANRVTLAVAFGPDDPVPMAGEEFAGDLVGVSRVDAVRQTDSPEPGLEPGERVYVLEVTTQEETPGGVADL